ncbi:ATP-dependent DNA helicase [Nemorincola caseinilytica]
MLPLTDTETIDTSNTQFRQAVAFVTNTREHLFLTGRAGTGKTTFLKYIKEHCGKQCAVIAPTGVAAMNAGGETIHSFLQLPFGPFAPGRASGFGTGMAEAQDAHSLLANLRMNEMKKKLIRRLDLLIIDEVSMVRADVLDAIDLVLRHVRRDHTQPFGGVQMVLIGDPYQLPPVVTDEDHAILGHFYNGPYFFDSWVIRQYPPVYIELKKIYRQKEQTFIDLLNRVRNGNALQSDVDLLNERYRPGTQQEEGYIVLCTHNHIADDINKRALDGIDAPLHTFEATINGEVNERSIPGERLLQLKKGAQVMFIKNDLQTPRRYYNGKIGKVAGIGTGGIKVSFTDSSETVEVPLDTWRSVRYTLNKQTGNVEEEELGSFTQFPLRLAWAVTVHKSQGLTLEKAIVDLNRAFAPGQVYVALSRCTSLDGLVLRSPLELHNILVDERVMEFSQYENEEDELDAVLAESELKAKALALQQRFMFGALLELMAQHLPDLQKVRSGPKEQNLALHEKITQRLTGAEAHAALFGKQLQTLLAEANEEKLAARLAAAAAYFDKEVLTACLQWVDEHLALLREYQKVLRQTRIWMEVKEMLVVRQKEMRSLSPALSLGEGGGL